MKSNRIKDESHYYGKGYNNDVLCAKKKSSYMLRNSGTSKIMILHLPLLGGVPGSSKKKGMK